MTQHTLHVATTHDDGHVDTRSSIHAGTAQDAHDRLARRWKNAGYDHQRDKAARTLTRVQLDGSTLVVAHLEPAACEYGLQLPEGRVVRGPGWACEGDVLRGAGVHGVRPGGDLVVRDGDGPWRVVRHLNEGSAS